MNAVIFGLLSVVLLAGVAHCLSQKAHRAAAPALPAHQVAEKVQGRDLGHPISAHQQAMAVSYKPIHEQQVSQAEPADQEKQMAYPDPSQGLEAARQYGSQGNAGDFIFGLNPILKTGYGGNGISGAGAAGNGISRAGAAENFNTGAGAPGNGVGGAVAPGNASISG